MNDPTLESTKAKSYADRDAELALLRALVRSCLDPLVAIDQQGRVLLASESIERVFRWKQEELVGQNIRVLMPEPHKSAHDSYLEAWRRTGITHIIGRTREFKVQRKDGSHFLADLSVSQAVLPGDEVVFLGSFRDVDARRRAEHLLQESEARFRAVFDGTLTFMGLLAPDGTLLEANATAMQATGTPRESVLGRKFWEGPWWQATASGPERIKALIERAATGVVVRDEFAVAGPNGRRFEVDFSITPVRDEQGALIYLIPEGRDITEQKRAQQAETSMLRALAQVGESAAVLVHEIKNPITAVNVALRAVADQLGAEHKVVLEDLATRMQRLQELMRGTLSFAKPVQLKPVPVEARQFLEGCVARLRLLIVRLGADVRVEVAPPDLRLNLDPALFEEVLANLVINALDAQGQGAKVVIRAAQNGEGASVDVDDHGPGIPESKREDIFRPFVTTKTQGTGLGLPICKKIVEAHGGTIDVASAPTGGARFSIRLWPARL
jgi:PAS domain S-box-containing protein